MIRIDRNFDGFVTCVDFDLNRGFSEVDFMSTAIFPFNNDLEQCFVPFVAMEVIGFSHRPSSHYYNRSRVSITSRTKPEGATAIPAR